MVSSERVPRYRYDPHGVSVKADEEVVDSCVLHGRKILINDLLNRGLDNLPWRAANALDFPNVGVQFYAFNRRLALWFLQDMVKLSRFQQVLKS